MQGRGRWVIHHRGAGLIHGFLELHRHRLQGASSAAARPGGFSGNAFCNKICQKSPNGTNTYHLKNECIHF
jgi:hypothetical protein